MYKIDYSTVPPGYGVSVHHYPLERKRLNIIIINKIIIYFNIKLKTNIL
jgi:hypothetical protein